MTCCLVVDDSSTVRLIVGRIVSGLGFEATLAGDGQRALELCRKTLPDLVLLDWRMPVMNGLDFLLALRRLPGGQRPVVVFCSMRRDIACIDEALSAGADDYILKPVDRDMLRRTLARNGVLPARHAAMPGAVIDAA